MSILLGITQEIGNDEQLSLLTEFKGLRSGASLISLQNSHFRGCMFVCMVITYSKCKDQPGKIANPARGQLNRENKCFPVPVGA